jgi:hypothetical protein
MGGVFLTCGLTHLVPGLTVPGDLHSSRFDVRGIPASLYFLWVALGLHRASRRDWTRRPLVGQPTRRSRTSPWEARSTI